MAMNVEISASVLSSLFYEHATSGSDLEGFLLGKINQKHTDTIDDAQINNVKEETTCYIYNFVLCRQPCFWYSSTGAVDVLKLKALLSDGKAKEVVGWYKFRRNTTLRTSLRERAVHINLLDCFAGILPKNFVFLLCAPQLTENKSTHTMDHLFQVFSDRRFQSLSVSVTNLGDSVSEYKVHGATTVNCRAGQFAQTIKQHTRDFVSKQGQLQSVQSVHSMSSQLQKQLQDLCACVSSSEEELHHLRRDIRQLKSQLKPPAKHKTPVVKQDSNPFSGMSDADSGGIGSQPQVFSATNPFYTALPGKQPTVSMTLDNPPPSYSESYTSQKTYPQSKNPFVTAPTTLAPPEVDLISLRDSDDESSGARKAHKSRHNGTEDDKPSTLMDMDMSQPIIANLHQPSTVDWNNSNSNDSDAFDFVADMMKGKPTKGGSVAVGKKEQPQVSRTTRSRATTSTASKPVKTRHTVEAIELSSDEDQTQDMDMTSDSPVY